MPTIGKDREYFQISVPRGTKRRFDELREALLARYPEARRHCHDKGLFFAWLIQHGEEIVTKAASANLREDPTVETLLKGKQYLLAKERDLALWQQDLMNREEKLLADRREWEATRDARQKELQELGEQVTVHRQVLAELQDRMRRVITELKRRAEEYDRATLAVAQACATARDVSLYVDFIRQTCEAQGARTIWELPPASALVVAGVILEAVAAAYGDKELTLVPGPKHPLPMQVTVREIARSLAPVEAYQEQMRAQVRMQARAEMLAAQAPAQTPS